MKSRPLLALLPALLTLSPAPAHAQPADADLPRNELSVSYFGSGSSDLDRNGKVGTARIDRYVAEGSFPLAPTPTGLRLTAGFSYTRDSISRSGAVPLPDKLHGLELSLGGFKDLSASFGPEWSAFGSLSAGSYADTTSVSGDSLNFAGLLAFNRAVGPDFSWIVGVMVNSRGENRVLPIGGLRWQYAQDWTLTIGFPLTGVTGNITENLKVKAGFEYLGGTYYVSGTPGTGLGQTHLEYQVIRLGGGIDYRFMENFTLSVDAGMSVYRRFDYYDRGYTLKGSSSAIVKVGVGYRF